MLFPDTNRAMLLYCIRLCFTVTIASLTTASGWSQQPEWKQQANQRIRNLRQRDAQVRVLAEQGQPVAGVVLAGKHKNFPETQIDEYVAQIEQLIEDGAPIHGIGIQGHVWSQTVLEHPETLKTNLDKVSKLGLPIWISEYDSAFDDEQANAGCTRVDRKSPMNGTRARSGKEQQ